MPSLQRNACRRFLPRSGGNRGYRRSRLVKTGIWHTIETDAAVCSFVPQAHVAACCDETTAEHTPSQPVSCISCMLWGTRTIRRSTWGPAYRTYGYNWRSEQLLLRPGTQFFLCRSVNVLAVVNEGGQPFNRSWVKDKKSDK